MGSDVFNRLQFLVKSMINNLLASSNMSPKEIFKSRATESGSFRVKPEAQAGSCRFVKSDRTRNEQEKQSGAGIHSWILIFVLF